MKEAAKMLESLETFTIYYHNRVGDKTIEKVGRKFYALEPIHNERSDQER